MAFTWQSAGHAFASLFKDVVTVSKKVVTALGGLQNEEKLIESLTSLVSPQAAAVEQIAFGALGELVAAVQATETAAGANGVNVTFDASVIAEVKKLIADFPRGHRPGRGGVRQEQVSGPSRMSCLIHGVLLLILLGCAAHRPIAVAPALPDPEIAEAKDFVVAVADKMPLWDADDISRYERVEIATVKADIAMAQQAAGERPIPRIRDQAARRLGCAGRAGRDAKEGVAYMSSKDWIEQAIKKPAKAERETPQASARKTGRDAAEDAERERLTHGSHTIDYPERQRRRICRCLCNPGDTAGRDHRRRKREWRDRPGTRVPVQRWLRHTVHHYLYD